MHRPSPPPRDLSVEDERLLDEALDLAPEARAAWMRALGASQPDRLDRLAPLLAELDADDGFLAPAAPARGAIYAELCAEIARDAERPLLAPGDRLGPYLVTERVGRGGMGEVYRARDEQLGRNVALKVLAAGSGGDQRVARLQREARLLAALNHPNVAAIFGLVSEGATAALVMEFVGGPTLADRLRQGPLPVDEAVAVAQQLVDALDVARARRIVHCDLKPANIAFARDGRVKVLDFGVATVWRGDPAAASASGALLLAAIDAPPVVAGTAAYMSPEQVRGDSVGHRSDIWAFGCVLFEMLSGARAFDGHTTADVLARVLESPPNLARLPASTPPSLRLLVERCLVKDASQRLDRIADARPLLEDARRRPAPGASSPRITTRRGAAVALVAVLLGGAGTWLAWRAAFREMPPVVRLTLPLPATDELVTGAQPSIAISPDGRAVVYRARHDGTLQLFRRTLDAAEPTAVAGTENASGPFTSPDGRWIGFHQDGALMKVAADGGTPVRIAEVGGGGAASSWSDRDEIVVAPVPGRGLLRVSAAGGTPVALTTVDPGRGELFHRFPDVLPGGQAAIFTLGRHDGTSIAVVDFASGAVTRLTEGRQARYLPGGTLLVVRGDALWAAPFDAARLTLTAEPRIVLRGLDANATAHFAVTAEGTLAYVPPRDLVPPRSVVWIDRQGREAPAALERRRYLRSSLSPDGTRVALVVVEDGQEDVWVQDLERGTSTRLTADPGADTAPVWTPDGRAIVFRSDREGGGLFLAPADASAPPERIAPADGRLRTPYGFTADGRTLLFSEFRTYRDQGIGEMAVESDRTPRMILDEPFAELRPALSPDGRWLAYQADGSGRFEVFVCSYPDVHARRWQVSSGGGTSPQWSADGRELFFHDGQAMVVVDVGSGPHPFASPPRRLFAAAPFAGRLGPTYSVSPDGRRFLMIREEPERDTAAARRHVLVVQHWTTELSAALAR